jgi:hypothetical protein
MSGRITCVVACCQIYNASDFEPSNFDRIVWGFYRCLKGYEREM